jgi:hypothetical protein
MNILEIIQNAEGGKTGLPGLFGGSLAKENLDYLLRVQRIRKEFCLL